MNPTNLLNMMRSEVDAITSIAPHKVDIVFSLILSPENFSHQLTMSKFIINFCLFFCCILIV